MARNRIDLRRITGVHRSQMHAKMASMARSVRNEWRQMASSRLQSTREVYKNAIVRESLSPTGFRLALVGTVPNMVEQGMGPSGVGSYGAYDVRKFLLRSPKAKIGSKGQRYITVPFRRSARTIKQLGGNQAYKRARQITEYRTPNTPAAARRMPSGYAPNLRPYDVRRRDPGFTKTRYTKQYRHKTDPLSRMIREETRESQASKPTSVYTSFRTASSRGDPWMSMGVKPRDFAGGLHRRMPQLINDKLFG